MNIASEFWMNSLHEKPDSSLSIERVEELRGLWAEVHEKLSALIDLLDVAHLGDPSMNSVCEESLMKIVRDALAERQVLVRVKRNLFPVDLDHLELLSVDPVKAISMRSEAGYEAAARWNEDADEEGRGTVKVQCSHPGCRNYSGLGYEGPEMLLRAERDAVGEVFCCHVHRESSWVNERLLGTREMVLLAIIRQRPGISLYALAGIAGRRYSDKAVKFLSSIDLIQIQKKDGVAQPNRIFLTQSGDEHLTKCGEDVLRVWALEEQSSATMVST